MSGDAAHRPVRVALAPDRLPQGQRRLDARGRVQAQRIAGHRSAVVVEDDRQPGSRWPTVFVEDPQVQRRVDLCGGTRGASFSGLSTLACSDTYAR